MQTRKCKNFTLCEGKHKTKNEVRMGKGGGGGFEVWDTLECPLGSGF